MATRIGSQLLPVPAYRIPELLQDIRLLDLLELSGSSVKASQLLSLSQPTVSRRYRLLAQDFGLEQAPRQLKHCRYGTTQAMRCLRLGCRAHRLAAGVARIGADLMHQHLLKGIPGLLPVPARFRSIHKWASLVHEGVLDGAVVSGLEIQAAGRQLDLEGLQWEEIGSLPLALGVQREQKSGAMVNQSVLLPMRAIAPGIHRLLQTHGFSIRAAGPSCADAEQWLQRLTSHDLAMPLHSHPASFSFWAGHLRLLSLPTAREVPVGFLWPDEKPFPMVLSQILAEVTQRISTPWPDTNDGCTALSQEKQGVQGPLR